MVDAEFGNRPAQADCFQLFVTFGLDVRDGKCPSPFVLSKWYLALPITSGSLT